MRTISAGSPRGGPRSGRMEDGGIRAVTTIAEEDMLGHICPEKRGLVQFVPAAAYHFFLNLPATQSALHSNAASNTTARLAALLAQHVDEATEELVV